MAATIAGYASPAWAVLYRFDLTDAAVVQSGRPIDGNTYSFFFDSNPVPDAFDAGSFTLSGTALYRVTFSPGSASDYSAFGDFIFYTDPAGLGFGGLDTPLGSYFGPQLFTGETAAPAFLTGTFALDGGSLTIASTGPAAVPEPMSWAMLVTGFGVMGSSLRARRAAVRLA